MVRVVQEPERLIGPRFADRFVGREAASGFQATREVVGGHEVGEVLPKARAWNAPYRILCEALTEPSEGSITFNRRGLGAGSKEVELHRSGSLAALPSGITDRQWDVRLTV